MAKLNKFVAGMLVGAAVGAATGVLLAPQSGKETRKSLRGRAGSIGKKAGNRMGGMLNHRQAAGVPEQPARGD